MVVSYFRSAKDTAPVDVSLFAFLSSEKHKATVEQLRAETDPEKRAELKKKLPAATISGTFTKRKADAIQAYNGLVCLDFDGKDNPEKTPEQMKAILGTVEEVLYAGLSVSGSGVFAIVPTDNTDPSMHGRIVSILGATVQQLGLEYDKACKDICRLRFISYDPQPVYNPEPAIFEGSAIIRAQTQLGAPAPSYSYRAKTSTEEKVEKCLKQIEQRRLDITANYSDWISIGIALATEFGLDGETYYHRVSQFNPKYSAVQTANKYAELHSNGKSVHIGSFFFICAENGITV